MKKLHKTLILLSLIFYGLLITSFNSFTITQDANLGKMYKEYNEIQFEGQQSDFDFLLKYQKASVIVDYDDGNKGVYDPIGEFDDLTVNYNKERYYERYFNREDYLNKTSNYVQYFGNTNRNDQVDEEKILRTVYFMGEIYKIYNLFYHDKPITRITILGDEANSLKNDLIQRGFKLVPKSNYSLFELIQPQSNDSLYINPTRLILIIGIVFSVIIYMIEFYYIKNTIRIYILHGMTLWHYVKRYFLSFLSYLILSVLIMNILFNFFDNFIFFSNQFLMKISVIFIIFYSGLYALLSLITIMKMRDEYEIF